MYKVLIERGAEQDLDRIEPKMRNRVIAHLLMLKNNTRTNAKKLKGTDNVWRIRVGDFRIIYEIEDKTKAIKIYRIKHRSKAY